jgi:uncharacterized protein YbjT (DUF2867 family)
VTVFGATGAAGGSVANYLLADGTFTVRAVTRNVNSDKAKALAAKGAEVVGADMDKPETLAAAIAGSYGVLGMTDFWTLLPTVGFDTAKAQKAEELQGQNLIDTAKAAGVEHFVFLSLPAGDCPHFQGKDNIVTYLKQSGLPFTNVCTTLYFENLLGSPSFMFAPDGKGGGNVTVPLPADAYMPLYSVDQTGGWVLAAFKSSEKWLGQDMFAIGEYVTPRRFAAVLSTALGKTIPLREVTLDEFNALDALNPKTPQEVIKYELHTMFREIYRNQQPPNDLYNEEASRAIYPGQHDLEGWVKKNESFKEWAAKLVA